MLDIQPFIIYLSNVSLGSCVSRWFAFSFEVWVNAVDYRVVVTSHMTKAETLLWTKPSFFGDHAPAKRWLAGWARYLARVFRRRFQVYLLPHSLGVGCLYSPENWATYRWVSVVELMSVFCPVQTYFYTFWGFRYFHIEMRTLVFLLYGLAWKFSDYLIKVIKLNHSVYHTFKITSGDAQLSLDGKHMKNCNLKSN